MKSQFKRPFLCAVAGGPCSGKTQVCHKIMENLQALHEMSHKQVCIIPIESFYKKLNSTQLELESNESFNFVHPDAFDFDFMEQTLTLLCQGENVRIQKFRHSSLEEEDYVDIIDPDVVLIPGLHMLYHEGIRKLLDLKIFIDVDGDVRLTRQVLRESQTCQKVKIETILTTYLEQIKPAFEDFILPCKKFADMIIPRGDENVVAIDVLTQHILQVLLDGKHAELFKSLQGQGQLYGKWTRELDYYPVPQ